MRAGFTLLELSIVIAIIGLIAGSITVGAQMLESARLQSTLKELQEYQSAVTTFRDKYGELPGDLRNASSYWPVADFPRIKNGNGDGHICSSSGAPAPTTGWETDFFWQHLTLAELAAVENEGWQVSPPAPVAGAFYAPVAIGLSYVCQWRTGSGAMYADRSLDDNYIAIGTPANTSTRPTGLAYGSITGEQAFTLDQKIDDGLPHKGQLIGYRGRLDGTTYQTGCATEAPSGAGQNAAYYAANVPAYDLTSTESTCHLLLRFMVR